MVASTGTDKEDGEDTSYDATILKIMLEEDKKLSAGFWQLVAMGEFRLKFLMTLNAGVAAAIGLTIQHLGPTILANTISGFLYVGLLIFGLATFRRTLERSLGIRICAEELKQTRHFIREHYPETAYWLLSPDEQLANLFAHTRFSVGPHGSKSTSTLQE